LITDQAFMRQMTLAVPRRVQNFARVARVLVVVDQESVELGESVLRMGCAGLVSKHASASVLRNAVHAISAGEFWVRRQVLSRLLREFLLCEGPKQFTSRETEILSLVASGYSNRQIAEKLFITRETVRWHVRSLYAKTGIHDRPSMVCYAAGIEAAPDRKLPAKSVLREASALHGTV